MCRYGDPLDAWADLASMKDLLENHMLPGGLLFFSVPVGKDTVVFNAHRVYGYVLPITHACACACYKKDPSPY
jgi:hypothetical protein